MTTESTPPTNRSQHALPDSAHPPDPCAAAALTHDYPLPWSAVIDEPCTRLVAANGATVLACNPEEAAIVTALAAAMNTPLATFHPPITALAAVLADLDDYPTADDFVDDLILAAEAVVAAVTPAAV
jgi:hypothetical protein